MDNPLNFLLRDKPRLGRYLILALVPWLWAVFFVPPWVAAAALVVALLAVFVALMLSPTNTAAVPEVPGDVPLEKDSRVVRRESRPLRRLLARWYSITQTTTSDLGETQGALQEVIEESETAVLNISKSFRNITSRSTQQIEYAMGLLQTTRGPGDVGSGDGGEDEMSLPEYVRAYEVLLNLCVDRLRDFSNDCLQIIDKAEGSGITDEALVSFCARLRKLATENHADADQVRADAVHLSGGMVLKNQQVTDVLKHINTTAQEIRRDVNQLVIAMQFQDITQQKLERLRGPLLGDIIKSLSSISDETRVLSKQLKMGTLPLPSAKDAASAGAAGLPEDESLNIGEAVVARKAAASAGKPKPITGDGDGNSVELF